MFAYGYSPYLSLFARQQEEDRRRQEAFAAQRRGGFLVPRQYGGEPVDPALGRQALGQALIGFGAPLLRVGSTGDYGGALSEAVSGFAGTMSSELERGRQIARQQNQDELAREAEERRQQHEEDYFANLRRDDERAGLEAERKAADAKAKVEREEAERKAEVGRRRALIAQVRERDPQLADQLDALAESEKFPYGEAVAASKTESPAAAAREERSIAAAERAARAEERSIARDEREEGQQATRERSRAVEARADELFNAWLRQRMAKIGKVNMADPGKRMWDAPSWQEQEQWRAWARQKAAGEVSGPSASRSPAPSAGSRLRFNPETGELE